MNAEQKLQEIVDNGRANVQQALMSIQTEYEQRKDIVAKPPVIDFDFDRNYNRWSVKPVIQGNKFNMTPHSENQLFGRTGVPRGYADKLAERGEWDLLRENLNTMTKHTMQEGAMVRRVGETIKGWLTPSYKRMDGTILFESFINSAMKANLVPYNGKNTDYRYQIGFIYPKVYTPSVNEALLYGLSLMTGDYGGQTVNLEMMVLRIVCSNLAIGYNLLRKIHLGKRFNQDEDFVEYSTRTHLLDAKAIASGIGDVVRTSSRQIEFLDKRIEKAANTEIGEAKLKSTLESLKREGVAKDLIKQVEDAYSKESLFQELLPAGNSLWRLSNAISLVAQSAETEDKKLDMTKLAMDVLN